MKIQEIDLKRNANNFDAIRLIAASFVIIGHAPAILANKKLAWDPFLFAFGIEIHFLGVLIFFILSGFLVTKSWHTAKHPLDFLLARFLRIFPAMIVVIILSVFVMGVMLTSLNLNDYLLSGVTSQYLQNLTLYRMYYHLPGVFENNPIGPFVNGSLWTLPYEFTCYLFLFILGMLQILRSKWAVLSFTILLAIVYSLFTSFFDAIVLPILGIDFINFIPFLLYFLTGSVGFLFREYIRFNVLGVVSCLAGIFLINYVKELNVIVVFILSYLTFYLAFSKNIKWHHAAKYGDFSYGLYLYAFPVQQMIVFMLPNSLNLGLMLTLSFLFTCMLAIPSWILIEKPALSLRSKLKIRFKKMG